MILKKEAWLEATEGRGQERGDSLFQEGEAQSKQPQLCYKVQIAEADEETLLEGWEDN